MRLNTRYYQRAAIGQSQPIPEGLIAETVKADFVKHTMRREDLFYFRQGGAEVLLFCDNHRHADNTGKSSQPNGVVSKAVLVIHYSMQFFLEIDQHQSAVFPIQQRPGGIGSVAHTASSCCRVDGGHYTLSIKIWKHLLENFFCLLHNLKNNLPAHCQSTELIDIIRSCHSTATTV
jgi:hypothetical protein